METTARSEQLWHRLWLPAIVCMLLLMIEIWAIFFDEGPASRSVASIGRPAVAVLTAATGEVRNKSHGTIAWEISSSGVALQDRDSVATMPQSAALLSFTDGSEMLVEENSLIIVEQPKSEDATVSMPEIQTKVLKGGFTRKKAGKAKLKVQVGSASKPVSIHDEAGDAVFKVQRDGKGLTVAVEQGSVRLNDTTVLETNDTARIENAEVKVQPRAKLKAPRLKSPELKIKEGRKATPKKSLFSIWVGRILDFIVPSAHAVERRKRVEVRIEWEPVEGATSYKIEIAESPAFESIVKVAETTSPAFVYTAPVPKKKTGLYFRVAAIDDEGTLGEMSDIQSVEIDPPKPEVAKPRPAPVTKPAKAAVPPEHRAQFEVSLGGAYQIRKFSGMAASEKKLKTVNGSGFVPALLSLYAKIPIGQANEKARGIYAGGVLVASKGTPQKGSGFTDDSASVPYFQVYGGYSQNLWSWLRWGAGPYVATTSRFSVSRLSLVSENVMMLGAALILEPHSQSKPEWPWRARIGLTGVGALGVDAGIGVRHNLTRWGQSFENGFFGEIEGLIRMVDIEKGYGASLRVGYGI